MGFLSWYCKCLKFVSMCLVDADIFQRVITLICRRVQMEGTLWATLTQWRKTNKKHPSAKYKGWINEIVFGSFPCYPLSFSVCVRERLKKECVCFAPFCHETLWSITALPDNNHDSCSHMIRGCSVVVCVFLSTHTFEGCLWISCGVHVSLSVERWFSPRPSAAHIAPCPWAKHRRCSWRCTVCVLRWDRNGQIRASVWKEDRDEKKCKVLWVIVDKSSMLVQIICYWQKLWHLALNRAQRTATFCTYAQKESRKNHFCVPLRHTHTHTHTFLDLHST